jgi:hypothetical protein
LIDEDLRREKSQTGPEAAEALRAATEHFAVLHARLNGLRAPGDHDAISGCLFQYLDAAGEMLHAGLHPARCLRQSLIGLLNSRLDESGPTEPSPAPPSERLAGPADRDPTANAGYVFRKSGRDWVIRFGDAETLFPDSVGISYIYLLVNHPGRGFTPGDLKAEQQTRKAGPANKTYSRMSEVQLSEENLSIASAGDLGSGSDKGQ